MRSLAEMNIRGAAINVDAVIVLAIMSVYGAYYGTWCQYLKTQTVNPHRLLIPFALEMCAPDFETRN